MADDPLRPPPPPSFEACFTCGEILAQPPAWPFGFCDPTCLAALNSPRNRTKEGTR